MDSQSKILSNFLEGVSKVEFQINLTALFSEVVSLYRETCLNQTLNKSETMCKPNIKKVPI